MAVTTEAVILENNSEIINSKNLMMMIKKKKTRILNGYNLTNRLSLSNLRL